MLGGQKQIMQNPPVIVEKVEIISNTYVTSNKNYNHNIYNIWNKRNNNCELYLLILL